MRDNPLVGPAEVAPSLAVPGQANPTANLDLSFLASYFVRLDGQLFTVQQGGADESWH